MDVGRHHGIANGGQRGARLFPLDLQGALRVLALGQQLVRVPQGQKNQHQGDAHVGPHQQEHDVARAFAQGLAEVPGRRGHARVDLADGVLPPFAGGGVHRAGGVAQVDLVRQLAQRTDVLVAHQPLVYRLLHQIKAVKVAQQPDQVVNVIGVVATAQKAVARHIRLHLAWLQGQPGSPVAQRDLHGAGEPFKGLGGAGDGVLVQKIDGVLLAFGP